jgi:hypothetical protein
VVQVLRKSERRALLMIARQHKQQCSPQGKRPGDDEP